MIAGEATHLRISKRLHHSAELTDGPALAPGREWELAHVRLHAVLGSRRTMRRGVFGPVPLGFGCAASRFEAAREGSAE
jgi:hypothetical protein